MYPEHRAVWTILIRITTIRKKQKLISAASEQKEIMEEATGHIELAMEEYSVVTEHFSDIQLIDILTISCPTEMAERDNSTVDR